MHNFVVYRSSAGSGKTFTLVKEYLRLSLLDEKKLYSAYKKILAITFTNKAAAEMKQRVIDALDHIALKDKESGVGVLLCKELNITYGELKRRAGIVLNNILHHYSDFSIGTIDSFTHKIVKTFAHDLKLPVNFNIELDTNSFYEKVIATLFNQVGEDEYVSRLLKEYALSRAADNASWDPAQQIQEFSKLLQKENAGNYIEQLRKFSASELEDFRKQFVDYIKSYRETLKVKASEAVSLIKKNNLTDDDFTYKKGGPQSFFNKCINLSVMPADLTGARIVDAITNNKWAGSGNRALESIVPQLNGIARELIDYIKQNHSYYSLCEILSKQMYPLMLLKKIEEISLEQKQEDRLVFISEFNQKIFDIINNEPTPFIYERLGERYQHYLLDEFQDTSSLQWQNILPLLDNSLSNGWFNLIVGDGKQSIYRWRNANVQQFADLPSVENGLGNPLTEERSQSLQRNFRENLLGTNFRSVATIIEFNNALFGALSDKHLSGHHKKIYEGQSQQVRQQATGYITINSEKVQRDELDQHNSDKVIEYIKLALQKGFEYKDICILVRKNYQGNSVAGFLVEEKIPIVSSDSLLLKNNLEVNTIICYLQYLLNRRDVISAGSVLNYLFQSSKISEAKFHEGLTMLSANRSLFEILEKFDIKLAGEEILLSNLLDNCITFVNALGLNERGFHYIRFFLDEVNEFLVTKNSDVSGFLDWWESRSMNASMIIPENTNAVRIMTIHASKGLEFPVVIVPYCNWGIYRAGDSWVQVKNEKAGLPVGVVSLSKKAGESGFEQELETEQQEQVLDNLNLLYVAFTRAVERLHIISSSSVTNHTHSVSHWLDEYLLQSQKGKSGFYEIGEAGPKISAHALLRKKEMNLEPLSFTTREEVIRIKSSYLHGHEQVESAKQQGLLIHWLLSEIQSGEDLEAAFGNAVLRGLMDMNTVATLKPRITALITNNELAPYFQKSASIKKEAELVTGAGEILRPDRIYFSETETVIIDYKTGKENNTKYSRQLQKYSDALHSMGYKNIGMLLVYIDDMKVIRLK